VLRLCLEKPVLENYGMAVKIYEIFTERVVLPTPPFIFITVIISLIFGSF